MKKILAKKVNKKAEIITKVEASNEKLTSRGGLYFLNEFLMNTGIISRLSTKYKYIKKSSKGLSVENYFKQLFSYFFDGTKFDLTYFEELKEDETYCELLKLSQDEMASSHQIKRMTAKLSNIQKNEEVFRDLLSDMFIDNLLLEQPERIYLGIDTMVLNNDDSKLKEGCTPTYKAVKGFQPLQIYWNGIMVGAIFREGKCHSNHGDDVINIIKHIVKKVRNKYRKDIPIVLAMDSGFLSDQNLTYFEEELKIHYVCVGKMYRSIKDYIGEVPSDNRKLFEGKHQWEYIEFGNKLKSWSKFRRTLYVQQVNDNTDQLVLDFARSDRIIYTNIGMDEKIDRMLTDDIAFAAESVIELHHKRAVDELVNRDLKDFMTKETLPFRAFSSNQFFYYILVVAFNAMRNFQRKITPEVLYSNIRPSNFRRQFIDIAGKIIVHGCKKLKIAKHYYDKLKLHSIFERIKTESFKLSYY